MTKVKTPLLSLAASGTLKKIITFARRRKSNIAEKTPFVPDTKSYRQLSWRTMFLMARDLWQELSAAEKSTWESAGTARHMTGYAWFISQALRPNPGIYLPLAGGTMAGDIDMATHKIVALPDPAAAQDADTKAARDAAVAIHAAIAAAHHLRYADAEAQAVTDARIAIHAALPTVHQDAPALIAVHGEGHINLFGFNYDSIGQGTFANPVRTTQIFNYAWECTTNANGDNVSYKAYLAKGTYSLRMVTYTHANGAIMKIDIDAVAVASFDIYSDPAVSNVIFSQTGIVVATAGLKTIRLRADGKNPASGAYNIRMNILSLWRTS